MEEKLDLILEEYEEGNMTLITLKAKLLLLFSVMPSTSFELTWKNAKTNPPNEGGRYWCLVEEQNDLGKSHFQWNCSYHEIEKRWSDNFENYNVIWWTELAPMPF